MTSLSDQSIRTITPAELLAVGGGLSDPTQNPFGYADLANPVGSVNIVGAVLRLGLEVIDVVSRGQFLYQTAAALGMPTPGMADSNSNENDNGGTSYGTGVCNTFGCSGSDW